MTDEALYATVPGGLVVQDTESGDAVIEIARNYWNHDVDYATQTDPVYIRAEYTENATFVPGAVILGLSVAAATKVRNALTWIIEDYTPNVDE